VALHVVGGPDAGGVHLLHPGQVTIGRSAQADVPLDDPDVSRLHLVLTVAPDGRATVADRGSTNGTTVDGARVGPEPRPLAPGALLRIGESTLRLLPPSGADAPSAALPDGRGHLQLPAAAPPRPYEAPTTALGAADAPPYAPPRPAVPPGGSGVGWETTHGAGVPGWTPGSGAAVSPEPGRAGGGTHQGGSQRSGGSRARDLLSRGREALSGLAGPRPGQQPEPDDPSPAPQPPAGDPPEAVAARRRWPDPAALLLAALGAGPRLWERGPGHPDALTVRLGTGDAGRGAGLPAVLDLRAVGSLGLVGPRPRLAGLARAVAAQLATLHGPSALELVLVSADAGRPAEERLHEWSWLLWLPHLRPAREQQCRLLTGFDADQALARLGELTARTDATARLAQPRGAATVLLLDGDPGSAAGREAVRRLLVHGPAAGIHLLCLAEHREALPPGLGATAAIGGEVATLLRLERGGGLAGPAFEEGIVLDAVSAEWAARLARALAPLRERQTAQRGRGPLPEAPRLLDLLGLEMVTPAKLSARWAGLPATADAVEAVLGATREGPCAIELADPSGGPGGAGHLLVGGGPGSGKTELLRALVASLAVAERPDRLGVLAVQGRTPADPSAALATCADLPHVSAVVEADDPVRTLQAAEALTEELDRRERLLKGRGYASWYAEYALARLRGELLGAEAPEPRGAARPQVPGQVRRAPSPTALPPEPEEAPLPVPPQRLLVVVDDYDALLEAPASPASAGARAALLRALDRIALDGAALGIHLAATTGRPERTSGSALDEAAELRVALRTDDPAASRLLIHLDEAAGLSEEHPGRGYLRRPDGGVTAFQTARISGRIPRTATLRPTVVALEWAEAGAPPTRRPVRELGNGPTDLALLGSALQRAAGALETVPAPPLL
jgi:S-DNA-T family DNA segregation ATPase FtsK/SpoIIIE